MKSGTAHNIDSDCASHFIPAILGTIKFLRYELIKSAWKPLILGSQRQLTPLQMPRLKPYRMS